MSGLSKSGARLLVVLSLGGLPACIPMRMPVTPGIEGKVLSAVSLKPIANAKVSMSDHKRVRTQMLTLPNGSFSLPTIYRWEIVLPIGDLFSSGTLSVDHPAYKEISVQKGSLGDFIHLQKPILLEPLH